MRPCLKQLTLCIILTDDGKMYRSTNECDVDGLDICPRVTAECETGTGYELCGSTHAEQNAAAQIPDVTSGTAWLYGHDWFCRECQHALTAKGITNLVITGEPA